MRKTVFILILLILAGPVLAQPASLDDIRSDYAKADYRSASTKANKLLTSPQEPSPADKYELLMLRGECQLQLKDRLGAATSFKSAAKCASDVQQLANAKADALITE